MAESHTQQLAEIMAKIAKLPSSNLEPPQFFANFLQLTIAVTGSEGGAIWVLQPEQGPQCYCHLNLELCGIKEPDQQRLIVEAIGRTVKEEKTLVLPGLQGDGNGKNVTNQCPHPLFFKPLMAANKVAMLVQLIGPANLDDQNVRPMVGLLDQASEAAEVFLAHRRATVLDDDRKALTKLLQYAESVHNSLEPEKVVYQIANQGRDTIDCDRVIIWVNPKIKRGLRAVSGIDKPDRRAVLMQAAEKLSKHCLELKKPIVASRGQLAELPEEDKLTILLTDYFNVSQLDQVYLQPIMHNETYLGVLIAEGFDEQSTANLGGVISAVATHGATALANALDVAALPIMRPLARIKKASHEPKTKRKWQIAIVLLVTVAAVLCFLPWTVQIHCTCELMPKNLRRIESSLMDVKIEQILKADGNVNAGDVIARLDALDLRTELASLQLARNQEEVKRDTALTDTDRKISVLEIQRLDSNIALINEQIG
ncbi:MAG: hypothetical protein K9M57_10490, partial [Phycisphaerae bacterium]|nr:hypothetical protein [Phycisphaerae bacterium]